MCVCVWGGGSSTRKTLVCASSEDSRESVLSLESAHPYLYHRREMMKLWTMNEGIFDEISSFIAYAQ